MELKKYAIEQLKDVAEIEIYNMDSESGIITFNIKEMSPHDALSIFAKENISLRGGHMCNQLTLKHLKVPSVLRASIYIYNDKSDIDKFVAQTKEIASNADPLAWMF